MFGHKTRLPGAVPPIVLPSGFHTETNLMDPCWAHSCDLEEALSFRCALFDGSLQKAHSEKPQESAVSLARAPGSESIRFNASLKVGLAWDFLFMPKSTRVKTVSTLLKQKPQTGLEPSSDKF